MKMRKLFAGLAAAATLLSGLALGAGAANAAETPKLPYQPLTGKQVDQAGKVTENATFKFTSEEARQWGVGNNRVIEAYKLADYYQYVDSNDNAVFGVETADAAKNGVKDGLTTALKEYPSAADPVAIPADGTDLFAWALQNGYLDQSATKPWANTDGSNPATASTTRKFADALNAALAKNAKLLGDPTELSVANGKLAAFSKDGTSYTAELPAGIYLFLDATKSEENGAGSASDKDKNWIQNGKENDADSFGQVVVNSAPIILASGHLTAGDNGENYLYPLGDLAQGDNTVAFKNHVTPVTKTVDDTDKTVSTGQTVRYTLSTELPLTTGYDPATYTFTLQDFPGVGQTVNLAGFDKANAENTDPNADLSKPDTLRNNAGAYTVKVVDGDTVVKELVEGTDFDLTTSAANNGKEIVGAADKAAWFTLNFSKLINSADYNTTPLWGKKVVVEYAAKITAVKAATADDPNSAVKNTVEVNDNNAVAQHGTKLTLGQFAFTKTDAQGNATADINGATFVIKPYEKTKGNTAVGTPDPDLPGVDVNRDGKIDEDDVDHVLTPRTGEGVNTSDSRAIEATGKNGVVTFTGLADGTYEVNETRAPEGFLGGAVSVRFVVVIKGGKAVEFRGTDLWGLAPSAPNDGKDSEITDYAVKNVRNVTELPKTGAAGIAFFTLIGVLLASVAALVYVKSRSTRRALHA